MVAAAKTCGGNLRQSNQIPKLIIAHGIHLSLVKKFFVNNKCIEKDEAMTPKENRPSPLVLTHPVVNLLHIPKFITEVDQIHVLVVQVVHIQTEKVSATYHI